MLPQSVVFANLLPGAGRAPVREAWTYAGLVGTIAELSAHGASATTTLAMRLVWEAQRAGEPVAWVTLTARCFYPPDALDNGVDLESVAVVRVPDAAGIGKAADYLVRSGGFGLVVLDFGPGARLTDKQLTRLLGLARKHATAIVCLTAKPDAAPSLGGLVTLRGPVARSRGEDGRFACELLAIKDKRRSPGWRHTERCVGPPGLH